MFEVPLMLALASADLSRFYPDRITLAPAVEGFPRRCAGSLRLGNSCTLLTFLILDALEPFREEEPGGPLPIVIALTRLLVCFLGEECDV